MHPHEPEAERADDERQRGAKPENCALRRVGGDKLGNRHDQGRKEQRVDIDQQVVDEGDIEVVGQAAVRSRGAWNARQRHKHYQSVRKLDPTIDGPH